MKHVRLLKRRMYVAAFKVDFSAVCANDEQKACKSYIFELKNPARGYGLNGMQQGSPHRGVR